MTTIQWSKTVAKPLFIRRLVGHSMLPTYKPGRYIIASSLRTPKVGRVVIATNKGSEVIKRVTDMSRDSLWLTGDNKNSGHNMKVPRSSFIASVLL